MANPTIIDNLKLHFALESADHLHHALRSWLERGMPDVNEGTSLTFDYMGTLAYATKLSDTLKKSGGLVDSAALSRPENTAFHQPETVQQAGQLFEHELMQHLAEYRQVAAAGQVAPASIQAATRNNPWRERIQSPAVAAPFPNP